MQNNKLKKCFLILVICVVVLCGAHIAVYALSAKDIDSSSPAAGYYLPGEFYVLFYNDFWYR